MRMYALSHSACFLQCETYTRFDLHACSRVADLFQSVQLNVNNPTFLIMQGRITKVRPPALGLQDMFTCRHKHACLVQAEVPSESHHVRTAS